MRKSLILLFINIFCTSVVLADPVILYGPIQSDDFNLNVGVGLACFPNFSPNNTNSDFAIGSPEIAEGQGLAQIIYGGDGSTVLFSRRGNIGSGYGSSLASLGDSNGDGRTDLIVGAPFNDSAALELTNGNSTKQIILENHGGASSGSEFGEAVEGLLGPLPETAHAVAVVSAPFHGEPDRSPIGLVAFYDGLTGDFLYRCLGNDKETDGQFGASLSSISDLSGDGFRDLIVGAPGVNSRAGRVVVLANSPGNECLALYSILGPDGSAFGTSVANVGDVDGDGVEDFIAGGPRYTNTSFELSGIAILYSGATGSALCTIKGVEAGQALGSSVRGLGDTNYDGHPDFAIGSPGANSSAGQVTIYTYNTNTHACDLLYTLTSSDGRNLFGSTLAGSHIAPNSCDMTNDGYPEFLVGSAGDSDGSGRGSVTVYTVPTPTPTNTPTPTVTNTPTLTPTNTPSATFTATPTFTPTPNLTVLPIRSPSPTPTKTPNSHELAPIPHRAFLNYSISLDGNLSGSVALDKEPYNHCTIRIDSRYSNSNLTGVSSTRTLIRAKHARRITPIQALHLPKAGLEPVTEKPYILHLIAKVTCVSQTAAKKTAIHSFLSNVASRYLTCGSSPYVSIDTFTQQLSSNIR